MVTHFTKPRYSVPYIDKEQRKRASGNNTSELYALLLEHFCEFSDLIPKSTVLLKRNA